MYLEHFGLNRAPFSLTPDTRFYYNCASHHEALNLLLVALRGGEGFVKIVGEVGTGKTLVCRRLLRLLEPGFVTAYLPDPCLGPREIRLALADELGLSLPSHIDRRRLMKYLGELLVDVRRQGKRTVLVVDEAQALSAQSLDSLRLLTNLETESEKLLQVVLFGQPELDEHLAQRCMRPLRQRLGFSYRLAPLDRRTMNAYVAHRLRVAGAEDPQRFTPGAISALWRASRGLPRLVNILAHKALLCAYGRGANHVDRSCAMRAVRDTEATRPRWRSRAISRAQWRSA